MIKKGFTLIELLVGISVIIILTVAALPVFTNIGTNQTLTQNAENLKSDIRLAQAKAVSGAVSGVEPNINGYWGIRFPCSGGEVGTYILGQPSNPFDPNSIIVGQEESFSQGVYVECDVSQIVFERITGIPVDGGVVITIRDHKDHVKFIDVNSKGVVK